MKKQLKDGPDIADVMNQVQQKLIVLENKIDILISKSSPRPVETRPFQKPFQHGGHAHSHEQRRQGNDYRERVLHRAICADCKKECEVPFKPTGDRPVYCKDCFSKRKGGSSFGGNADNRPKEERSFNESRMDRPHGGEKKRFPRKKRPAVKRRKARG